MCAETLDLYIFKVGGGVQVIALFQSHGQWIKK